MDKDEWSKYIERARHYCSPEEEDKRLVAKWGRAVRVCALHVHFDEAERDGTFEILFVTEPESEKKAKWCEDFGKVDIIGFDAGVELARQPDCVGGPCSVQLARRIAELNEDAASFGIDFDSIDLLSPRQ